MSQESDKKQSDSSLSVSSKGQGTADLSKYLFIAKKTERLVTALYKVTEGLPDSEPVKTKLRFLGVEMLVLLPRTIPTDPLTVACKKASYLLSGLIALCDVARSTSLVSEMNFSILKEEFLYLKRFIEGFAGTRTDGPSMVIDDVRERQPIPSEPFMRHIKDNNDNDRYDLLSYSLPINPGVAAKPARETVNHKLVQAPFQSSRRDAIVSFIRSNPDSAIGKIAQVLPGVSEKTVQRELLRLTQDGVLIKTGERRWSRYRLAA